MAAPITYEIGTALGSIATLTSLGIVNPESTHIDYSNSVKLGSGLTKGLGFDQCEWHYGYLYIAQYSALRAFCSTAGAAVCIATLNNDMSFVRYNGFIEMPLQFVIRSFDGKKTYMDVTIKFSGLELAE